MEALADAAGIENIGLPASDEAAAASFSGGKISKRYLDGSVIYEMDIRIMIRSPDQLAAADRISGICGLLTGCAPENFKGTDKWKILSVGIISAPSLEKTDERGICLFSCELSARCFFNCRN